MCGIVSAVAQQNIVPVLVQGLQRLEYRGYDSCGVAVWNNGLQRARSTTRVADALAEWGRWLRHLLGPVAVLHGQP